MLVIVCYDIADDRRRDKMFKTLEGFGRHVQESVFECDLTAKQMDRMRQKVKRVMKAEEDNVRLYLLCEECRRRIEALGVATIEREQPFYIV